MAEKKKPNQVNLGPTGKSVSINIKRAREKKNLTLVRLSELTESLGRKVATISIRRIEEGTRRVDVDDLMVLAQALETSPAQLLLDPLREPPFATGVPEDLSYLEAVAWIQGKILNLESSTRYKYLEKYVEEHKCELKEKSSESTSAKAKMEAISETLRLLRKRMEQTGESYFQDSLR